MFLYPFTPWCPDILITTSSASEKTIPEALVHFVSFMIDMSETTMSAEIKTVLHNMNLPYLVFVKMGVMIENTSFNGVSVIIAACKNRCATFTKKANSETKRIYRDAVSPRQRFLPDGKQNSAPDGVVTRDLDMNEPERKTTPVRKNQ